MSAKIDRNKSVTADRRRGDARKLTELQKALAKCESEKSTNMEALLDGTLDRDEYQRKRDELNARADDISARINELESRANDGHASESTELADAIKTLKKYADSDGLTSEMVKAFVKDVFIYDPTHIEIKWNFSDEVMKAFE